ncbi:Putative membrane protein [Streptomyces microflavus DSM 40593]|uniref:Membrane protein n=1 Tax=Streptomyces microflavus DSM 40593 TaxID=1303692 RepID=N0CMF3_STRMI|nr:Putative membrane protein [Streptomyces microflavus DSM 40593]
MSSWRSWHRPLVVFSAVMALWALVSAVGLVVDDRVLAGAPIWAKPFKFTVSLAAYGLTLAWMLTHLTRGHRTGWWAGNVVVLTSLVEMTIITVQVVRGKRSHFNAATPLDTALFSVMGITIIVLWAATLAIGILLLRASIADRAAAWAIRGGVLIALVGAGLGFLMTLPSAEQQAAGNLDTAEVIGAHSVGVPDGGPAMPLTGWSTTGGDLRAPHFVGMHALQLIPLFLIALVLLAPRLARLRDAGVRLRLVRVATAGYAGLVALTTWQALRGQSLIHPDAATLMAAGVQLAAVAAGVWAALRTAPGPASVRAETEPASESKEFTA